MENIPKKSFEGSKAKIDYPCVWPYKIIGTSQEAIQQAVAEQLGDAPYSLSASRTSGSGKYTSMALETSVANEEQRLRLYHALGAYPAIKVVL